MGHETAVQNNFCACLNYRTARFFYFFIQDFCLLEHDTACHALWAWAKKWSIFYGMCCGEQLLLDCWATMFRCGAFVLTHSRQNIMFIAAVQNDTMFPDLILSAGSLLAPALSETVTNHCRKWYNKPNFSYPNQTFTENWYYNWSK